MGASPELHAPPEAKASARQKAREEAEERVRDYIMGLAQSQDEWEERAESWIEDPRRLTEWFTKTLLVQIQWLNELVNAPPGMLDIKDKLKAAGDLRDLGEMMDEALSSTREKGAKKR